MFSLETLECVLASFVSSDRRKGTYRLSYYSQGQIRDIVSFIQSFGNWALKKKVPELFKVVGGSLIKSVSRLIKCRNI